MKSIFLVLASVLYLHAAYANDAAPLADDPVTEQRLISISEEMRCLVCQNESLAGSRSDLANDLRREIRTLIKEGKSDEQIRAFMVERYGDFVLLRPPVKMTTLFLWLTPAAALFAGLGAVWLAARRPRVRRELSAHLTEDERRSLSALGVGGNSDLPKAD